MNEAFFFDGGRGLRAKLHRLFSLRGFLYGAVGSV